MKTIYPRTAFYLHCPTKGHGPNSIIPLFQLKSHVMDIHEGKQKFIESWGKMASDWGINRTMAQVHALLLIAPEPLTADQVMEDLNISRGNANMNIRALMDWGLVKKTGRRDRQRLRQTIAGDGSRTERDTQDNSGQSLRG